jgi:hypothetical protein
MQTKWPSSTRSQRSVTDVAHSDGWVGAWLVVVGSELRCLVLCPSLTWPSPATHICAPLSRGHLQRHTSAPLSRGHLQRHTSVPLSHVAISSDTHLCPSLTWPSPATHICAPLSRGHLQRHTSPATHICARLYQQGLWLFFCTRPLGRRGTHCSPPPRSRSQSRSRQRTHSPTHVARPEFDSVF